jgi:hypothetical protein
MTQGYRHLDVERRGDVFCARLRSRVLAETEIHELADELVELGQSKGCRGLALSLGPLPPECLYSVFLAKLFWVQRVLGETGACLVLCEVDRAVQTIFEAVKLDEHFRFAQDFDAAVAAVTA